MDDSSTTASFSEPEGDPRIELLLQQRQSLTDSLHASPYDAILYLERAVVHSNLGYPDLAAGDAYRALLLADEVRDESGEYHDEALAALRRYPASPLPKVLQHGSLGMDSIAEQAPAASEAAIRAEGLSDGVPEHESDEVKEGNDNNQDDDDVAELYELLATVVSVRCTQILSLSLLLCGCLRSAATFAERGLALAPTNPELLQNRDYIRTMARRRLGRGRRLSAAAVQNAPADTQVATATATSSEESASSSDSNLTLTGTGSGSGPRTAAAPTSSSKHPPVEPYHVAAGRKNEAGTTTVASAAGQSDDDDDIPLSEYPDTGLVRREVYPWNTHEPDRFAHETLALLNRELAGLAPKCEVRVSELPLLSVGAAPHSVGSGAAVASGGHGSMGVGIGTGAAAAAVVGDDDSLSSDSRGGSSQRTCRQLGLFAREDIAVGETVLEEYTALTACGRVDGDFCDACSGELPSLDSVHGGDEQPVACPSCADAVFCSTYCASQAQALYHPAVCPGQSPYPTSDARNVLDSTARAVPAGEAADALHLLLLARVMAMALHQNVHPLRVREVRHIWGDFLPTSSNAIDLDPAARRPPPDWTLPFSWKYNVEAPLHILAVGYGVDVFQELDRTDLWVLNTLQAKFRGTASARKGKRGGRDTDESSASSAGKTTGTKSGIRKRRIGEVPDDGRPDVAAVHPFWCLANHDCDPNVRWGWAGRMRLSATVRRGSSGTRNNDAKNGTADGNGEAIAIPAGHEILNHYCDVDLPVRERREWMRGSLGGWCVCARCREEERREAEARGGAGNAACR